MQFENLPNWDEANRDADIVDFFVRRQYFRKQKVPSQEWNQSRERIRRQNRRLKVNRWCEVILIPDIWPIVCSFLFNRQTTYTLSIPVGKLVTKSDSTIQDPRICSFLGAEDGKHFRLAFGEGSYLLFSGNFDFPIVKSLQLRPSFTWWTSDVDRRYLIRFTLNPQRPKNIGGRYFIWNKSEAKWISKEEARTTKHDVFQVGYFCECVIALNQFYPNGYRIV